MSERRINYLLRGGMAPYNVAHSPFFIHTYYKTGCMLQIWGVFLITSEKNDVLRTYWIVLLIKLQVYDYVDNNSKISSICLGISLCVNNFFPYIPARILYFMTHIMDLKFSTRPIYRTKTASFHQLSSGPLS